MGKSRDNTEAESSSPSGTNCGRVCCSWCLRVREQRLSRDQSQTRRQNYKISIHNPEATTIAQSAAVMPMNLPPNNTLRRNSKCDRSIKYRRLRPFKNAEIHVLLLENVSPVAVDMFVEAGFQVPENTRAPFLSDLTLFSTLRSRNSPNLYLSSSYKRSLRRSMLWVFAVRPKSMLI